MWGIVGALSIIRAETTWIPLPLREARLLKWLPSWPWTAWAFGAAVLLLVVSLEGSYRIFGGTPDREEVLGQLGRLRAHGIKLLNADFSGDSITGDSIKKWIQQWSADQAAWCSSVVAVLRDHYPERTRLRFENLGTYTRRGYSNFMSGEHRHELENLGERLAVLDDIMADKYGGPK